MNFDGWWQGTIDISCDFCHKRHLVFNFYTESEAKDYEREKRAKKRENWITLKSNGHLFEFCSEKCRNNWIKQQT